MDIKADGDGEEGMKRRTKIALPCKGGPNKVLQLNNCGTDQWIFQWINQFYRLQEHYNLLTRSTVI